MFDQATIKVTAQYKENYAFTDDGYPDGDNPIWKNKGGYYFEFKCDPMDVHVTELCEKMCERLSNECVRYEYVDHTYNEEIHNEQELADEIINELLEEA